MSNDRGARNLDFVVYRAASARGEGHLANVADTGVFVRTDGPCPKLDERVELLLQGLTPALLLRGASRWVGRRQDGTAGFGARLIDPPEAYLHFVHSLAVTGGSDGRVPQRVAPRMALSIPVAVEFGSQCDEGTLMDLSLSGARLEQTGIRPPQGSQVRLTFSLADRRPFEIVARVVRETDSGGYAVHFAGLDPIQKAALADAVALAGKLDSVR